MDALISIKPKYTDKIISGEKTIEIRRRSVNLCAGTRLWIYSTLPVGAIAAFATIEDVFCSTPNAIWDKYHSVTALSSAEYRDYTSGCKIVSAIKLTEVFQIKPISLFQLRISNPMFFPPQFYLKIMPGTPNGRILDTLLPMVSYEQKVA
jgi:predicted transcriptional regulator